MSTLDLKVFTAYCISPYSQGYRHIDDKNRFGDLEKSMSKKDHISLQIGPVVSDSWGIFGYRVSGKRLIKNKNVMERSIL